MSDPTQHAILSARIAAAHRQAVELMGKHRRYRTPWTDEFDVCTSCTRGMELVPWPCDPYQAADRIRRTLTGGEDR